MLFFIILGDLILFSAKAGHFAANNAHGQYGGADKDEQEQPGTRQHDNEIFGKVKDYIPGYVEPKEDWED